MKRFFISLLSLTLGLGSIQAADYVPDGEDITVHVAAVAMPSSGYTTPSVKLEGTGASRTFTVSAADLGNDVTITATSGFSIDVTRVEAGKEAKVTVTNTSYRKKNVGKVIMRSGDYRSYINLTSYGSDLEQKDIQGGKVSLGSDEKQTFEGFAPTKNGFTVEIRAKVDDTSKNVYPFAVSKDGVGFKGYVNSGSIGLYNGANCFTSDEGMSNPSNGGTFYNTDGQYHTYRYAVTPDERVIVYRDGITIDSMRVADLALQPDWCVANGEVVENLLKNADFEGEYDHRSSVVGRIEGWDVYPWDQWNSTQGISSSEQSNTIDQNNHALWIDRYMWSDGWAAGEVSQIVNVAPNETYSFSALAKGGIYGSSPLGSIRIYDLQNSDNKQTLTVNSDSWQTYATDFETKANTQQIRVSFYLERAKWGASVSSLYADHTKLTGVSREIKQQIGFENNGADIEYFAFDNTGAYAPLMATMATSTDSLTFNATGQQQTVNVNLANLVGDVTVSATSGFSVSPSLIKAGTESVTLTVTNDTYRHHNSGKIILRSGDMRKSIALYSTGSALEEKDIQGGKVTLGNDERQTFEGFNPTDKGYTVEIRAKVDDASKNIYPFATTDKGIGFKGYVNSTGIGLYNGANCFVSDEGLSNPTNGGTFYNTDGEYHTYRYAVTPDQRVIVYRDGICIDSMRVADLAAQPEWSVENGEIVENLIKNPGFEGEYDYSSSRSIVTHIEGWDVYPYDQYNSTQGITTAERNNAVDQNNHALWIDRYMWNDGWAAGEVSQIVDVAPNETYSFSALAKGGIYGSSPLGSIRIYDLQNESNKQTLTVNSDSWQTYATDFETKANTKQIRVSFYLERAKWGASVSSLTADDVKLTGTSRVIAKTIGFENNGADIGYFAFDNTGAYAPLMATIQTSADSLKFNATGQQKNVTVTFDNLVSDLTVTATSGYSVSPALIKAGTKSAELTITNSTYRHHNAGKVVLRAGDKRKNIYLYSNGSDLQQKDITAGKVTLGKEEKQTFDGFQPGDKGYTVEIRAKVDDASKNVYPFAVTKQGVGFKAYVNSGNVGLYNGADCFTSDKNIGSVYNKDGEYHTYRYAVTPDERIIVYRDGITIDSMRVADLALQPDWMAGNGEVVENLLKNADFEGEYDHRSSVVGRIEGWDVYPWDQWNSTQGISSSEQSKAIDQNNHALWIDRYMWDDGWAAGEISQIVNVAPNETYSFSALAKGGIYGTSPLGSIRIYDLQNSDNKQTLTVNSDSWQTYATDFETKANTKQIRVSFYLERAKWGASVSSLYADHTKLTGVSREIKQQIGFENNGADIEYFAFDNTGAYAPLMATIEPSVSELSITGTGAQKSFDVNLANLVGDVTLTASNGFAVYPTTIKAGKSSATVTVTNTTYRKKNVGKITLRSGDKSATVRLTGYPSDLEPKDISGNAVALGTGDKQTFEGFAPTDKGYTVEVQVKVDDASKNFYPFATTDKGVGFKGYVNSTGIGLYNGSNSFVSDEAFSNPSNGGTFYNTDGEYHTYRYAVTPDQRVIVYRDGITIDSMRVADLAPQADWSYENGRVEKNLLRNPGFEGEYDYSKSRSIITRIEGWDVYPYDQYNSYQEIVSDSRTENDHDNHAVSLHRYMWNDGWAAGEISQIVDVAPNEYYRFSALAKGGMYSGNPLGSIRIYDLQNEDNKQTLTVSGDSYKTYATEFETKANTKQIRVSLYLERAKWGASVSGLRMDDAKLTGVSRLIKQQIGFENNGADIRYFAFDNTGAYAPNFPTLQQFDIYSAIEDTEAEQSIGIKATIGNDVLILTGVASGSAVAVYGIDGTPKALLTDYVNGTGVGLPGKGSYIILVTKDDKRQSIKVQNR